MLSGEPSGTPRSRRSSTGDARRGIGGARPPLAAAGDERWSRATRRAASEWRRSRSAAPRRSARRTRPLGSGQASRTSGRSAWLSTTISGRSARARVERTQLLAHDLVIASAGRAWVRAERHEVQQQAGPLDVPQKAQPEPDALAGALDEPGMSATTNDALVVPSITTPRCGSRVVNG